jgi:hypothetical protein
MNPDFWWNWWVQFAVALGTIGAVVTALWAAMRQPDRPLLKMKVLRDEGERTFLNSGEDVRNYHLKVWNEHRSTSLATRVQVYLTLLEETNKLNGDLLDGDLQKVWHGNLPLRWRDQEFVPRFQKLGSAKDADLCIIRKQGELSLLPLFMPNNLKPYADRKGACRLILSLQARSNQADSEIVRIEIWWDGMWADGDGELKEHLRVRPFP